MIGFNSLQRAFRHQPYRNIFLMLMALTFIDAVAPNTLLRGHFTDLMLVAILLAALMETVRTRHNGVWALILGLPAIGVRLLAAFREGTVVQNTTVLALTAVFFGFLIWNLLHDLNRGDRSTSERIFGALCAYVFIGILFALIYAHLQFRDPGAFVTSQDVFVEQVTAESNFVPIFTYYSFITLTTLGYGDITPVSEQARTLAWFEALIGQLYLAVMVAGLVAVHISESMSKNTGDPPPDHPGGGAP